MENAHTYLGTVAAAVLVGAAVWYTTRRWWTLQFNGPYGLPLVGNVPQIDALNPHHTFHQWYGKHGGVFLVRIFSNDVLVVSELRHIHEALLRRGHDFSGRPSYFRTAYITDYGEDIAFHQPDAVWKAMRMTAHKCVKMYDTGLQRIEQITMTFVADMVEDFRQSGGRPYDPRETVYNIVMNIITVLLLGKKYGKDDDFFRLLVEVDTLAMTTATNGGKGSELDVFPFLRFFGNATYRKLEDLHHKRKLLSRMLRADAMKGDAADGGKKTEKQDEKQEGDQDGDKDGDQGGDHDGDHDGDQVGEHGVIRALINLKETTNMITDTNVDCAAFDLVLAGTSTTTNSILCLINLLANTPRVQRRLQDEIDGVLGEEAVTLRDRERLPYVQATLFEILRFTSLVPLGLPHQTITDTQLDGKFVPKGVHVFFNLWTLHHDEAVFPDPYAFTPDRFLDKDGVLHPPDHAVRRHLCPFGVGQRVCFGEMLARSRMFLVIATIAQKFDMVQDEECRRASCHPHELRPGIVLAAPDFTVRLLPRTTSHKQ